MEALCNILMCLINNQYLWYAEHFNIWKSFAHPEVRQRRRLIKAVWKKQKSQIISISLVNTSDSYFSIRFLLNSQRNKWIMNIFMNRWYHSYQNQSSYQIVTYQKERTKSCCCEIINCCDCVCKYRLVWNSTKPRLM